MGISDFILRNYKKDRAKAHRDLFPHRHKDTDPAFHKDMMALLYDQHPRVAMMAFRGAAKSTYMEEYALMSALFREAMFILIVGPKWESACERIFPIRKELENNDVIIELFGDQKSAPWSMDELCLANGSKIQAIGAGQSMRGKKHNDERPDLVLIDDLEDEENIRTEESRDRTERWLSGTLLPSLHPTQGKVRLIGTAIHPKSLIIKKCNDRKWKSMIFPILNIDLKTGEEKSAWPGRFPLEWIKEQQQQYLDAGRYIEFEQEYMCRAEDTAGKPFQPSMIKVEAAPSVHLPVEMFVDPARTVGRKSSRTGYAAWSWIGNKLIVHEAEGHFHRPDEIISKIMEWDDKFKPVMVGVEAVGLEEFLMQPLRSACVKLGKSVPWKDYRAPKDKDAFIRGLQPYYIAGEIIHAKYLPDLESELLQFPSGRKDVVNALAYALRMRAGRPVYEDFTVRHMASELEPHSNLPRYLCVSSRPSMTAGALMQYVDGTIKIYHDWVYNEPPRECFPRLLREAILIGGQVKVTAPQEQFDQYTNNGLVAAVRKESIQPQRAGWAAKSEGQMRDWLRKQSRGEPILLVNEEARWTINGMSRGYARGADKGGRYSDKPIDNQYRLVLEAIESFVAWMDVNHSTDDSDGELRYAYTDTGKRYISLRPDR